MELTNEEKEALIWALRDFRDNCPERYDVMLVSNPMREHFCTAWDKLKQ